MKKIILFIIIGITIIGASIILVAILNHSKSASSEYIIEEFNNNIDSFIEIEKYINEEDVDLFVRNDRRKSIVTLNGERKKIEELIIGNEISTIMNRLNYCEIQTNKNLGLKGKQVIVFRKCVTGDYERGIVFLKEDDGKYGQSMIKLRDSWYCYFIGYV